MLPQQLAIFHEDTVHFLGFDLDESRDTTPQAYNFPQVKLRSKDEQKNI